MKYHVFWEVELDASGPVEAAKVALEMQRDRQSMATVFELVDEDEITYRIDADNNDVISSIAKVSHPKCDGECHCGMCDKMETPAVPPEHVQPEEPEEWEEPREEGTDGTKD